MLATPEGRTYYFNELTKQTTWEKPEDLKTPFEVRAFFAVCVSELLLIVLLIVCRYLIGIQRAIAALPWKEFTDQKSSRKYYYNAETKQTVWQPPDEWKALIEKKERGELLE
jgi:pre-mRNA-processing factor 40